MTCKAVSKCLFAALLLAMVGCSREDEQAIVVQQVPKQPAPSTRSLVAQMMAASGKDDASLPPGHPAIPPEMQGAGGQASAAQSGEVTFADPPGWIKDPPMEMRYASYHIGPKENLTELMITPTSIPLSAESRLMNINRWRGQVGMPLLKDENDLQESKDIMVGGVPSALFDFTGPDKRQIAAWVPRGAVSWFFKIIGPKDVVDKQLNTYMDFLKSVQFASEKP